jgi:hypothetical protein
MTWKQDIVKNLRYYPSIWLEGLGLDMANLKQNTVVSAEIQTTHFLNTRHKQWNRTILRNTQGGQKVEFFYVKPTGTYSDYWALKI